MSKLFRYEIRSPFSPEIHLLSTLSWAQCRTKAFCIAGVYGRWFLASARKPVGIAPSPFDSVKVTCDDEKSKKTEKKIS